MRNIFSPDAVALLKKKLPENEVKLRENKYAYVTGHYVISTANRIFGFDGWDYTVSDITLMSATEQMDKPKSGEAYLRTHVSYAARVQVNVNGVIREDIGCGHGIDRDPGKAHESAIKEAVTDALKRALRTFGDPLGLALYEKIDRGERLKGVGLVGERDASIVNNLLLNLCTPEQVSEFKAICAKKGHDPIDVVLRALDNQQAKSYESLQRFAVTLKSKPSTTEEVKEMLKG